MKRCVWPGMILIGLLGTSYFSWALFVVSYGRLSPHCWMVQLGYTHEPGEVWTPENMQARERVQRIVHPLFGTSLLCLAAPASLLLWRWQRQVNASGTCNTPDSWSQAGYGLTSLKVFRGVLLCLVGMGVALLGNSLLGGGGVLSLLFLISLVSRLCYWGLAMLAGVLSLTGLFLAITGLLRAHGRRSAALAGILLNGIVLLAVSFWIWLFRR